MILLVSTRLTSHGVSNLRSLMVLAVVEVIIMWGIEYGGMPVTGGKWDTGAL